jgi:hypothetical protein
MNHHVYFWLKDERNNPADRATFEGGLASLFEIPQVAGGRWAVPAAVEIRPVVDQSWHYALAMEFANIADHDIYQVHDDHTHFVDTFKDWWQKVVVHDLA